MILAIGALGGSGTRVVAQIVQELGVFIGDELNHANDNLVFTILFKNPNWYKKSSKEDFTKRLTIFKKYMEGNYLEQQDLNFLIDVGRKNSFIKFFNTEFEDRLKSKLNSIKKLRKAWGWKEPNTQIFANQLLRQLPSLKYLHVLRHGLDMAFSKNKQQLINWGEKFEIKIHGKETSEELAYKQLAYWIASTKEIKLLSKKYKNRFRILTHENLCTFPKLEIEKMVSFIGSNPSKNLEDLYNLPQTPQSNQRFKNFDLGIFDEGQLDFVKEMGFQI